MDQKIIFAAKSELHFRSKRAQIFIVAAFIFSLMLSSSAAEKNDKPVNIVQNDSSYLSPISENYAGSNNRFTDFLFDAAMRKINFFSEELNAPPPCELDYLPTGPISFNVSGGTGNFPIFNRNGQGACSNPGVTLEDGSPAIVTNIGGAATPNYTYQVFFRIAPNLTGEPRPINFDIYTNGFLTGEAQILQSDGCAYKIGLAATGLFTFSPDGGQVELVAEVSPDCASVNTTSDVSWIHVVGTTLIVDPYSSSLADFRKAKTESTLASTRTRSGTITVQGAGSTPVAFKVTQLPFDKRVVSPAKDKFKFRIRTKSAAIGVRG